MLARLRCLGTGAALGLSARYVAQNLVEDPDFFGQFVGDKIRSANPVASSSSPSSPKKTVAVIRMSGQIAAPSASPIGDQSINLTKYNSQLTAAFKMPNIAAVAIEINSPGGSPVQSALLYNRLRALKAAHPNVPLLCYCTDVCASGGYYIAAACDEIHVLPSSVVGSIGVVSPSVGLVGLLKQYGIEDRTLTAGASKAGDSPLLPRDPIAVAKKTALLEELHEDFKA